MQCFTFRFILRVVQATWVLLQRCGLYPFPRTAALPRVGQKVMSLRAPRPHGARQMWAFGLHGALVDIPFGPISGLVQRGAGRLVTGIDGFL